MIGITRFRGSPPLFRIPCGLLLLFIAWAALHGQDSAPASPSATGAKVPAIIARASQNEVAALQSPQPFRYLEELEWFWGTETRQVIETPQGRADRILQFDGEPLAPDQIAKQERRLKKLLNDSKSVRHEIEDQNSETRRRIKMMKAFPSAFIFEPAGEEDGLLKFSFRPNRSFSPKDRETQVYRGMQGNVWVEPTQARLTKIEGTLTRDVAFGWGIFGRLYKGGRYHLEQAEVEPGVWRITTVDLELKIRVFLSTSRLLRREHNTEFRPSPTGLEYQQAVRILLKAAAGPDR